MKKTLLLLITLTILAGTASAAVPGLQLFIAGARYDRLSQTWITNATGFDLYVVSSGHVIDDVIVSVAIAQRDNPNNANVNFNGHQISSSEWVYGYPPIDNVPEDFDPGDMPRHRVFPTWFVEEHTGAYGLNQSVGNVVPYNGVGPYWDPSTGMGQTEVLGDVKRFHVETGGGMTYVHFDAYATRPDGTIWKYAPYSHDAEMIANAPEPGTLAMLGMGLFGLGAYSRRKKLL